MDKLSKLFCACAYDEVDYQQASDSVDYAFVEKNDTLYIYFQGSNSKVDWVRNFLFFKKPYKDMKVPYYVHGGFLAAWKEVEDLVINKITEVNTALLNRVWINETDFIDRIDYKFKKIIIVGYSHGGALSGLCHECVWYHRPDIRDNIFGFGFESPRFYRGFRVKEELKERWSNYLVIRNYKDIVTFSPPALFCFTHVGKLLTLKSKGVKQYAFPACVYSHHPSNVYRALVELEENEDKI